MDKGKTPRTSTRDFLHLVFKRKIQILLFFGITVCTVAVGSFVIKPTYEATAQILIKVGRENIYMPTLPTGDTSYPVISSDQEEQINSEIEIVEGRFMAEKVVESLGPAVIYEDLDSSGQGFLSRLFQTTDARQSPLEKALIRLRKGLTVEGVRKSNVINISFKHKDPDMAAIVVNTLVSFYLDHHLEVHRSPQSYEFFQEQSQILKDKVKRAEDKLEAFKKEYNLSVLRVLLDPQSSVPTSLEEERTLLRTKMSDLRSRLVDLELKEHELLTKYNAQSRLVQSAREEIRMVRKKLAERESRLNELNQNEMEFNRLQREVEVNRQNHRLYLTKVEESRISKAMDEGKIANVSVIEPARPPLKPVGLGKKLIMVLAIILGGIGGLGLAFFSEYLDDSLERAEDVENLLQLPVLASIPELRK